jgi:hypothetical protein
MRDGMLTIRLGGLFLLLAGAATTHEPRIAMDFSSGGFLPFPGDACLERRWPISGYLHGDDQEPVYAWIENGAKE